MKKKMHTHTHTQLVVTQVALDNEEIVCAPSAQLDINALEDTNRNDRVRPDSFRFDLCFFFSLFLCVGGIDKRFMGVTQNQN